MKKILLGLLASLVVIYLGLRWGVEPTHKQHAYYDDIGFEVIAHGAGQGLQPKNTLEAALVSHGLGADIIEIDIHATRDAYWS